MRLALAALTVLAGFANIQLEASHLTAQLKKMSGMHIELAQALLLFRVLRKQQF